MPAIGANQNRPEDQRVCFIYRDLLITKTKTLKMSPALKNRMKAYFGEQSIHYQHLNSYPFSYRVGASGYTNIKYDLNSGIYSVNRNYSEQKQLTEKYSTE